MPRAYEGGPSTERKRVAHRKVLLVPIGKPAPNPKSYCARTSIAIDLLAYCQGCWRWRVTKYGPKICVAN